MDHANDNELLAAIDLGSNSFHLIIAEEEHGEIRVLDKRSEKVQLAAGLNKQHKLSKSAINRGLDCLKRFAQHIEHIPKDRIKTVGTSALRQAKNSQAFTQQAENILNCTVDIIPGHEEARLIYLGVSHSLVGEQGPCLAIDIGGGSTEIVVGESFSPKSLNSLPMGCIGYQHHFPGGKINKKYFKAAYSAAQLELRDILDDLQETQWKIAAGSSGTVKAIALVLAQMGLAHGEITRDGLKTLTKKALQFSHWRHLSFEGLLAERKNIFVPGLAILNALFDNLNIELMYISQGALREGVLYDMLGRLENENVQERTISALESRYSLNTARAQRIKSTSLALFKQITKDWDLTATYYEHILCWSARLSEIGRSIAQQGHHKHACYIVENAYMPGFSRSNQLALAALTRNQRRRPHIESFTFLNHKGSQQLMRLCVLLRLGVLLNLGVWQQSLPEITANAKNNMLTLSISKHWLDENPLIYEDLQREAVLVTAYGIDLRIKSN